LGFEDVVAVHMGELFLAVREGMARVVEAAQEDAQLQARLEQAASKHFVNMEGPAVDSFLARTRKE